MAAPVDQAQVGTNGSSSTTSQTVNLPASISAGDILLGVFRTPTSVTSLSLPSGWVKTLEGTGDGSTGPDRTVFAYKIADGTEGATMTVTLGTAARLASLVWRVTGGDTVTMGGTATFNSAAPNPAAYTPVADAHDILWVTVLGQEDTRTITTQPSGYSNQVAQSTTGGATNTNCTVFGASKGATGVTSEDPGVWALSGSEQGYIGTFAVYTSNKKIRTSQAPVEVLMAPTMAKARYTQAAVEVIVSLKPPLRISQAVVEVVIGPAAPGTGIQFYAYVID